MTRDQFNRLVADPATISLNFITDLEEITRRYPYFTNAHLLLAKQYHGHENIRFDSYLKKASAYAPDRSVLYQLIKKTPATVIHMTAVADDEIVAISSEDEIINERIDEIDLENNSIDKPPLHVEIGDSENRIEENFIDSEISGASETILEEQQVVGDEEIPPTSLSAMEVIEQRLREINKPANSEEASLPEAESAAPNKPSQEFTIPPRQTKSEPEPKAESESGANESLPIKAPRNVKAEKSVERQPVAKTSSVGITSDPKVEEPHSQTENNPPARSKPAEVIAHSFQEWLKIKSVPVIPSEDLGHFVLHGNELSDNSQGAGNEGDLLERFIKTDPRILAKKSEFYSPGNMARKSAVEHEDLISETLARIYAQQGNIPKAIDAYQRLSLKNPEKSAYFAALIKELEDNKED